MRFLSSLGEQTVFYARNMRIFEQAERPVGETGRFRNRFGNTNETIRIAGVTFAVPRNERVSDGIRRVSAVRFSFVAS